MFDDSFTERSGTRFLLFPQAPYLKSFLVPEMVWISTPPGEVGPGPSDDRVYVIDPIAKPQPYNDGFRPPFNGPRFHPALPDNQGHFDHLPIDSREFRAAHMFASVRFTLDIWERYFGHRIEWHFAPHFSRLELIPFIDWDNAQSGYGFIEAGYGVTEAGEPKLYSLNFDVISHELGHSIIFAEVGVPTPGTWTDEYRSFHESASDLIALISALHFETVMHHLLTTTSGNFYTYNELGRIGELSETEQIRLASNDLTMSQLAGLGDHGRSLPLTGAVFDFLVEVFQAKLVERGAISPTLAELSFGLPNDERLQHLIQTQFDDAFRGRYAVFREALIETRDHVGYLLASAWQRLPTGRLDFNRVARSLLEAEQDLGGQYLSILRDCLLWREININ